MSDQTSAAASTGNVGQDANANAGPEASPGVPTASVSKTDWLAYFVAITLPVIWLFTSYLASNTFIANVKIAENVTTGNFWNTTGGSGPEDSVINREALIWASSLPNSLYGAIFLLAAMHSDRTNAYMYAMVGNLLTLLASILFAFYRTPASVEAARIMMSFGESMLLPQGLRFAGYHDPQPSWAGVLAMWLFTTANVEMNVLGAVCSTLLLEHPNVSFYICVGMSGTSFLLLLIRAPIGLDRNFWQFWLPFTIPLDPMIILSAKEKAIVRKIKNGEMLNLETEELLVRNNVYPTASLFLYACDTKVRLSFYRFDYLSPILADVSLCFFGMTFGILAFTGAGLAHQAKNLSDPFERLGIYFFIAVVFIAACGYSIGQFHKHSEGSFRPSGTLKNHRDILDDGDARIEFHDTKFIHDDNWDTPLPFQKGPPPDVEAIQSLRSAVSDPAYLCKYKTFRSIVNVLIALLFAMTAFYSGLNIIITLLDAMGHNKYLLVSLVVFSSSLTSLCLTLIIKYQKVKWLCKVADYPRYYLTSLHFLTATLSLIMAQVDTLTLDNPWLIGWFLAVWSASVLATFSFLINAISDEYRSTVALSSAALDYVVQLSFVSSLALGRVFTSSVVTPKSPGLVVGATVIDNAQRSLSVVMGLQLIAALITLGGVNIEPIVPDSQNDAASGRSHMAGQQEGDMELQNLNLNPGHAGPSHTTPVRTTHSGIEQGTPETFRSGNPDSTPLGPRETTPKQF